MFDLEEKISEWRKQMLAAGIKTPVPLEELENHLREDIEQQVRSGLSEQDAFAMTLRQIGEAETIKTEFAKVRETIYKRLQRRLELFAGISNHQLATNMNTSSQNLEPGWATYLKMIAFVLPAFVVLVGMCTFVLPKLKAVCAATGMAIWKPITLILNLADFCKCNFLVLAVVIMAALMLLEWRSGHWPRFRRLAFGAVAYTFNILVLILITTMAALAVVAGAHLLPGK